ncbi:DEAD/DEAH box helicase family protein [Actinophytocola sp.]|uniref:DEAD/DEAH box helicase family protein n=1 Tax=Actinophytocola sp. TaxID=1872138 RepID=UPI0025BF41E4|nr:DEAD/DEAH box helicase family protein [Actinophytocola sp.]
MGHDHASSGPASGQAVVAGWADLAPTFSWRKSQRHLLERCSHVTDRRWHLCAPPGAGKTLVGLELARRHGGRTLVLSPTTAIRNQWRTAISLFGGDPDTFASTTLDRPARLYSVTYQLLGNPGRAESELRDAARRLWSADVAAQVGADAAQRRIAAVERDDPKRAKTELTRHVRALRSSLRTGEDVGLDPTQLLGAGTSALIDRIAAMDITCLVLDECHHLLDWWALVVNTVVERLSELRPVAVIGLTATLPDPDSAQEELNYTGLLGPVDAELHLAAMVAEGGIAPWRDGLRVAELEPAESRFLDTWSTSFAERLDTVLLSEPFIDWAVARIATAAEDSRERPAEERVTAAGWDRFWDIDPLATAALARWWTARGMALPQGFDPPEAAAVDAPLTLDDRLLLLDAWLHAPDATIPQETREDASLIVRRHGVSITTTGVRWNRSAADIVCSRSTAKGRAAGEILCQEAATRGDRLRALVVVERDRATSPPAAARAVLGEDAGTAARVLAAVCDFGQVARRGVVCVTGSGAWCDALGAERIVSAINVSTEDGRWATTRGCDIPAAVELVGRGAAWESAHWLRAARAALEDGSAHTLVATRGLVGEGWNYPALNVLVDLSEVASTTAMTQLRGRALRIDPHAPDKVASLWDVVIAHPTAHGDWSRFRRRHARWWGPNRDGTVVTGAPKVHPRAAEPAPPPAEQHGAINDASAAVMSDHAGTVRAWDQVAAEGIATSEVRVVSRRTRRQVRTRRRGWRRTGLGVALTGGVAAAIAATVGLPVVVGAAGLVVGVVGLLTLATRGRARSEEATLLALGEAVAEGLAAAGHPDLRGAEITGTAAAGGVSTVIHNVDDDAAVVWADAFEELLGPLGTPRWMLTTGDRVWRVPRPIGAGKDAASAFADAVRQRVPRARLVRAGTPEATELTLRAARERPDEIHRTLRWT